MPSLYALAHHLGLERPSCEDVEITALSYDSRLCTAGCLYFSFPGLHSDGDDFIPDAASHGAVAAVSSKMRDDIPTLVARNEDIRRLYASASAFFFGYPSRKLKTIGVTGTDGKTSTCWYAKQLIEALGKKCGILGTVYSDCGEGNARTPFSNTTPEAFDVQRMLSKSVDNGLDCFMLESSSHALSRDYDRLSGTTYALSAFTRISSEHLEFHKSLDAYIDAKLNLARMTEGKVLAYEDNIALERLKGICKERLVTLKRPEIVRRSIEGLDFSYGGAVYHLPFFAPFALENAFMAACLAGEATGTALESVLPLLSALTNPEGRQEIIREKGRTIIIDFAHTADAFARLFKAVREIRPTGAFIALFGASGERDRSKRAPMGRAAAEHCDLAVLTADDPRSEKVSDICREIAEGFEGTHCPYVIIEERDEAIDHAIRQSKEGDTIFLLGIGRQNSLNYSSGKRKWNERAAVEEALGRLV